MAEKKEYVKLWVSYESYFEAFSDVEVGRLVRAMIKYRASGEEPKFNGNERFIWPAVKRDIDESLQAQESTAAANRENGKKGGRPPKSSKPSGFAENPKNPSGFLESEKSHGLRTRTKDKDKVKVNSPPVIPLSSKPANKPQAVGRHGRRFLFVCLNACPAFPRLSTPSDSLPASTTSNPQGRGDL